MSLPKLPAQNLGQIVLAVWIVFSIIFVGNALWQNLQINAQKEAVNFGYQQAVVDLFNQAQTCQAFPINIGEKVIQIQALNCTPPVAETEAVE